MSSADMHDCLRKILDHARFAFDEKSRSFWPVVGANYLGALDQETRTNNHYRFVLLACTFLEDERHTLQ